MCVSLSVVIVASLKSCVGRTMGRMIIKSTHGVLGHLLLRSIHLHRTLLLFPHYLLRSRAPFRSFVRSLAHSLAPKLMGKRFLFMN